MAEPELMPTAVEELLRAYSPVTMARVVTEDVEYAGCPMKAGDKVLMNFPAANRDPEAFEHPDEVVLDRAHNRHVAFGSGIHRCAGSNLARMELQVALEEWLAPHPRLLARRGRGDHLGRRAGPRPPSPPGGVLMKIRVDPDKCQGHARCYGLAPEIFDVDDYGQASVIVDVVPARARGEGPPGHRQLPRVRHRDHASSRRGPVAGARNSGPDAPAWFARAVAVPARGRTVEVDGAAVHSLAWGEPGRRGLVFVHGGGAHAHWWTPRGGDVRRRVPGGRDRPVRATATAAHRDAYDPKQWTDEVMAVAGDAGIDGLPVVIGHSMGGFVTIVTAARHPDRSGRGHRLRLAGDRGRPRDQRPPATPSAGPGPTPPSTTPSPASAPCRPRSTTSTT